MGNPIPPSPPPFPPVGESGKFYCVTTEGYHTPEGDEGCTGPIVGMCQWCYGGDGLSGLFFWNCAAEAVIACFNCLFMSRSERIIAILGPYDDDITCASVCMPECSEY